MVTAEQQCGALLFHDNSMSPNNSLLLLIEGSGSSFGSESCAWYGMIVVGLRIYIVRSLLGYGVTIHILSSSLPSFVSDSVLKMRLGP